MLLTAVISIFVSEVLSDIACSEFITQSPCIMYGNSLLISQITQRLYAVPRPPRSCPEIVSAPLQLVHEHLWIDHNSLARHIGHFKCMVLGYGKKAAVTPSGLPKLQDV